MTYTEKNNGINVTLAENIKKLRIETHLSQAELGEIVGLTGQEISNIENGKVYVSIELVDILCRYFEKSPNDLFSYDDYCGVHNRAIQIFNNAKEKELYVLDLVIIAFDSLYWKK